MAMGTRMSCEERKFRILAAVRRIFAHKGLEGTTTRELAKEAGVSEALLYKHYPSKEALYQAMLSSCDGEFMGEVKKITSLDSSTSTLVHSCILWSQPWSTAESRIWRSEYVSTS